MFLCHEIYGKHCKGIILTLGAPSIYISKVQSSDSYLQTSCAGETDTPPAKTAHKFVLLVKKRKTQEGIHFIFNCVPLSCKAPTMKQAYALCARSHINLEFHVTAFTVFDLRDKQLSFSHVTSCVKMPHEELHIGTNVYIQ